MVVEHFHLAPPPGFRGLQPDVPITMYRRHLPHWRQVGATYAVTFRLGDSLPQSKINEIRSLREAWEREHPEPRSDEDWQAHAQQYMRLLEPALDSGYGECYLRDRANADIMEEALLHFQDNRYSVGCYVVMPNHCYVVVKPFPPLDLEDVLDSWKGYAASQINKRLSRAGALWQQESYDRIIRDEEHLYRIVQYIGDNPARAGLKPDSWHRWIDDDWTRAGWGFSRTEKSPKS